MSSAVEGSFNLDSRLQPRKLGTTRGDACMASGGIPLREMRAAGKAEKLFGFFTMCLTPYSKESGTSCCWGRGKKTLLDPYIWSDKPLPLSTKTVVAVGIFHTG